MPWHDQQALTEGMLRDMQRRQDALDGKPAAGSSVDLSGGWGDLSGVQKERL